MDNTIQDLIVSAKDWIRFGVEILTLVFLIVYVIKTWQMASATRRAAEATERTVNEMREARDQETAPYVIAYFDTLVEKNLIYLVIQNIGRSLATDVRVSFDPPIPEDGIQKYVKKVLGDKIASLPPNYLIRTLFSDFLKYTDVSSNYPQVFDVNVSYYGGIDKVERSLSYRLDLGPYRGIAFIHQAEIGDVVKHLEQLRRTHSKGIKTLEDILVSLKPRPNTWPLRSKWRR